MKAAQDRPGSEHLLLDRLEPGIALITLNRPSRLNALTREMVADLNTLIETLSAEQSCRAVVLTGAGRGFCSGQDLEASNERNQAGSSGAMEKLFWQEQFAGMGMRLRAMPQVVIAAVNGPAVAPEWRLRSARTFASPAPPRDSSSRRSRSG